MNCTPFDEALRTKHFTLMWCAQAGSPPNVVGQSSGPTGPVGPSAEDVAFILKIALPIAFGLISSIILCCVWRRRRKRQRKQHQELVDALATNNNIRQREEEALADFNKTKKGLTVYPKAEMPVPSSGTASRVQIPSSPQPATSPRELSPVGDGMRYEAAGSAVLSELHGDAQQGGIGREQYLAARERAVAEREHMLLLREEEQRRKNPVEML